MDVQRIATGSEPAGGYSAPFESPLREKIIREKQKLQGLLHRLQFLHEKDREVKKLNQNPKYIANCAYNQAASHKFKDNVEQIALEVSKFVNAFSVTENPYRHAETFKVAQAGKKSKRNAHVVRRIQELIPQILAENIGVLQRASKEVEEQDQLVVQAEREAIAAGIDLTTLTDSQPIAAVNKPTIDQDIEVWDDARVKNWIRGLYLKHEQKAERSKEKKQAIAIGIAQDLSKFAGYSQMDEGWFHLLYSSMEGSGRRWYNDACGEKFIRFCLAPQLMLLNINIKVSRKNGERSANPSKGY